MKPKGNSLRCWGVLLGTLLPLCFRGGAATMENPSETPRSPSAPPTPTPTSPTPEPTAVTTVPTTAMISPETAPAASTTPPVPPEPTTQTQGSTLPPPASTLPPGMLPSPATLATTPAAGEPTSPSEEGRTEAQLCEDSKKQILLICLAVIGVLVLLSLCLLLAVVALASKLAYVKRRQASQRLPRSNGDFLSTNSLWPAGLETLQRLAAEAPGSEAVPMQRTGLGPSGKAAEEASKKLAGEISGRQQQQKAASADPQRSVVTTVEI